VALYLLTAGEQRNIKRLIFWQERYFYDAPLFVIFR